MKALKHLPRELDAPFLDVLEAPRNGRIERRKADFSFLHRPDAFPRDFHFDRSAGAMALPDTLEELPALYASVVIEAPVLMQVSEPSMRT